jgi:hypothetical protein
MILAAQDTLEVRQPMTPANPEPSSRLLRAAAAERQGLARQRRRLGQARERLLAELRRIDDAMSTLDEREVLLERLAPTPRDTDISRPDLERADSPQGEAVAQTERHVSSVEGSESIRALRGPAIRETAVRLLATQGGIEALHYRAWFRTLADAGYSVTGKDPLAVFLTQISRSPVVRKSTQAGVYELDRDAPARLRRSIGALHAELRELAAGSPADLRKIRDRRKELTVKIGHAERALEEAERVLSDGETAEWNNEAALAHAS